MSLNVIAPSGVTIPHLRGPEPATQPTVEVRVARSIAEVEALRGIWSKWKTHRDSDIDYCLEFVWSSENFVRPHVIVIYRGGRADAILVGRLERARLDSRLGYLRVASPRVRMLSFAKGGILGSATAQNAAEFVGSVMNALRSGEADVALLHQLDTGSSLFEQAVTRPDFVSRDRSVKPVAHHIMKISGSVEQVYAGFSPGLRAELRRKKRKMLGDFGGRMEIQRVRGGAGLDRAICQAEEVARKTYQRGLGVGFRDSEPTRRWLQFCGEHGWLWFYVLTIDGQPSAFWTGTLYDGNFCSDDIGFDPAFSRYSPGTVLFSVMIEDFCDCGVREIDFGPGAAEYKERFGNCHDTEASVFLFAPNPKGMMLNGIRTAVGLAADGTKNGLERAHLLSSVKRLWRTKMAAKAGRRLDS
jgi:Acetyltransferase (GNAT) domain